MIMIKYIQDYVELTSNLYAYVVVLVILVSCSTHHILANLQGFMQDVCANSVLL